MVKARIQKHAIASLFPQLRCVTLPPPPGDAPGIIHLGGAKPNNEAVSYVYSLSHHSQAFVCFTMCTVYCCACTHVLLSCVAFLDLLAFVFFWASFLQLFPWFCYQLRASNAGLIDLGKLRCMEFHWWATFFFFSCLLVGYEWDMWSTHKSLKTTISLCTERQYSGHEFEQSPADGKDGRSLVGCGSWGHEITHNLATKGTTATT